MQFTQVLLAAATAALVWAQPEFTNTASQFANLNAGSTLNITWDKASGPVTLTLKTGPEKALTTVNVIQSGLTGTSYAWTIPSTIASGTYALQIDDSTGVPNYSVQFPVSGGSGSVSGTPTPTPTGSTSTGSSSSSSSTSSVNSTSSSSSSSSTTSESTSATPTPSGNSTTTSSTSSKTSTKTSSSSSGTSTPTSPPSAGSAANLASPLAFVLLAFGAMMTLN